MTLLGLRPTSSLATAPLAKRLVSSHRVAQALEWNKESGSILSLCIKRERIDLAVASHPATQVPVQALPSIAVKKVSSLSASSETTASAASPSPFHPSLGMELSALIHEWAVCGVVVHWPIQRDGGWCGAPCGRVLYTLDHLALQTRGGAILSNRPLCLWDDMRHQPCEDSWGRSPLYARPSNKSVHVASEEQYVAPPTAVEDVWHDFSRSHWPELQQQPHCQPKISTARLRGEEGTATVAGNRLGSEEGVSDLRRKAAQPLWLYAKSPL